MAVFTQPERAVGRGQRVQANGIKLWAQARGLPVLQPEKLTEEVRLRLAAFRADAGLVMAYGHILRDDFIATPRLGMLTSTPRCCRNSAAPRPSRPRSRAASARRA